MKKQLIDPYEVCPCSNGKKYKFCCYQKKDMEFHNSNEAIAYIRNKIPKLSFCLHEDEYCSGEIIKSHSIQNNKILSKLSVNSHVYSAGFDAKKLGGADLKRCGKKEATISTCFCLHHDTEIFKNIELIDYKYTSEQNLLYAYRAFSKTYYDKKDELIFNQITFQTSPKKCLKMGLHERIKSKRMPYLQ